LLKLQEQGKKKATIQIANLNHLMNRTQKGSTCFQSNSQCWSSKNTWSTTCNWWCRFCNSERFFFI